MAMHQVSTPDEWRQLGWIDGYRFGSDGRIQSCRKMCRWGGYTDEWRDVCFRKQPDTGHLSIRITVEGKKRKYFVHRLILEAFRGPCPEGMEALHWDDNPENNRIDNLRWGTHKENCEDKRRNGNLRVGKGSRHHLSKLTEEMIPMIRVLGNAGMKHGDIAARYGVTRPAISYALRGETWKHV